MRLKKIKVLLLGILCLVLLLGLPYQTAKKTFATAAADHVITTNQQKLMTQTIATFAPQVDELYISSNPDGGISINATATLSGYKLSYALAADIADRYLYGIYHEFPFAKVDFAGLYVRYEGRYVMAIGLGRRAEQNLSVRVFSPDRGIAVFKAVEDMNNSTSALIDQAYAEYKVS